jgi:Sulfatase
MRRQVAGGKPFFLYVPFSMGHEPNVPSKEFAGKSRIGNYGSKLIAGDYHVGQRLDALKELRRLRAADRLHRAARQRQRLYQSEGL